MIQCRRFYTDKNFKSRIIANSYNLRNLKNNQEDEMRKKHHTNISGRNINNIFNIKRFNTSNSTDKKIISNENDELMQEKLKLKREMSLKTRKQILSRLQNSKLLTKDIDEKEKKDDNKKIEIKIKEQYKNYRRINKNNATRSSNNLKKKYEEMNKNINENNDTNINNKSYFFNNYYIKNNASNSNVFKRIQKNQKFSLLLYKNAKHIYKKNIIKASILKEQNEIKNNKSINENLNRKYNHNKETVNKNNEDFKKRSNFEIKVSNITNFPRRNNNINIRFKTEGNSKDLLCLEKKPSTLFFNKNNEPINKMTEIVYNKVNKNNINRNSNLRLLKINEKDCEANNCYSYYHLNTKKKEMKSCLLEDNNKYSNMSFKLESYNQKTFNKRIFDNKSKIVNLKVLQYDNELNSVESEIINKQKDEIFDTQDFEVHFFENLINMNDSINDKTIFATLLNNLNQKYFNNKYDKYNTLFIDNENLEYVLKHFCLVLISLIFFSKDEILYNLHVTKVKEILTQIIYSSLNYIEMDNYIESRIIKNFNKSNIYQTNISIHRYVLSLINILFDKRKEYLPLKEALEQIHSIMIKKNFLYILKIINESILFCYNYKPRSPQFIIPFFSFNKNKNTSQNDNSNNNEKVESIPYIKSPMSKKFCLVLDIDETISHTLKLNFGGYFLLRPGAKSFFEEVSKYYEIIIFTSSPKKYADKILDRIDINRNYFSHRLYKNHVLYENGKTVKNLNLIGRDLTKTIFIDNLRSNAKYNLNNLCSITSWKSDIFDNRLLKLKDKLCYIATCGKFDDDITQGL